MSRRARPRRGPAEAGLEMFGRGRGDQERDDHLLDTVHVRFRQRTGASHAVTGNRLDNFSVLVPGLRLRAQARLPGARVGFS